MFSYFTSYLDDSYCNFRSLSEFFQMIGKYSKDILLNSLSCKITNYNCKSPIQFTKQ